MKRDVDEHKLRYLLAYTAHQAWRFEWYEGMIARYRQRGYDVEGFCVTQNRPGPPLRYPELDQKWRERDPWLLQMYERLETQLRERDVFILFNGANIHEDFVKQLSTFNVYICWDDPESSDVLSKPVAKYFDFAFTGNIGCVNLYKSWGVERVDFLPHGCPDSDRDLTLTKDQILEGTRDIDVVLLCERQASWRRERLDVLQKAFPQALMRGRGWSKGVLPFEQTIPTYVRSKIGWNVHNSVGPVNRRTYMLPANGIMQICDNKTLLGHLFKLNEEVVGFDTTEECIELTRYYLSHDDERRRIAAQGWERAVADYSEEKVWERLLATIRPHYARRNSPEASRPYQIIGDVSATLDKGVRDAKLVPSPLRRAALGIFRRGRLLARLVYRILAGQPKVEGENKAVRPYVENDPNKSVKWAQRDSNQAKPFEHSDTTTLNYAVAGLLASHKRILGVGDGIRSFAFEAAQDPSRSITCVEPDPKAHAQARIDGPRPNICFERTQFTELAGQFDLVVALGAIEHIQDYRRFLEKCVELAPCAILTTPNKNRDPAAAVASPPECPLHVREWTAGEFYWVLSVFYERVRLLSMPNPYVPTCVPIPVTSSAHPLIAICEGGRK